MFKNGLRCALLVSLMGGLLTEAFSSTLYAQSTPLSCKNCVRTRQIKNRSIKAVDIARGAISGTEIQDQAISKQKLASDIHIPNSNGIINLPGAVFGLNSSSTGCQYEFEGYWISTGSTCCLQAPVHFPDQVTATRFEATYLDIDAGFSEGFEIEFKRKELQSIDDAEELSQLLSIDDSELQVVANDLEVQIDTENFSYFVSLCFSGNANRFYDAKLVFE